MQGNLYGEDIINDNYISSLVWRREIEEESYVRDLPVVRCLQAMDRLDFKRRVTFFAGENGTGKSTLLEAIAVSCGFNAEGGSRNFNFSTADTHSDMYKYFTLSRSRHPRDGFFLRAESFYNVATNIDELDEENSIGRPVIASYGGRSLHEQSHGESFWSLITNRFGGEGLYILDEPEAALSPSRQMALLVAIDDLVKKDSQFIIATHSPIVMAYPGAQIYQLTETEIREVKYKDCEHYLLTRRFLENPEKLLKYLLEDD